MTDHPVELVRREDDAFVEAILRDEMQPSDLIEVEKSWHPARVQLIQELMSQAIPTNQWPQSLPWDWARKAPQLQLLHAFGFGIICEANWEGAILIRTATDFARLPEDNGKPIVYVDYLESAPWNWRVEAIGQNGQYKGVGSVLFRQAVRQSIVEGFKGRVGLHSLPQSEGYYEKVCGMTALGPDPNKQNLLYFEFTAENAHNYLELGGAQ